MTQKKVRLAVAPPTATSAVFSEKVSALYPENINKDADRLEVGIQPVMEVDPLTLAVGASVLKSVRLSSTAVAGYSYVGGIQDIAVAGTNVLGTLSAQMIYNPVMAVVGMLRTPSNFWNLALTAGAGDTVIVAGVANVRHRIMGYSITLAAGSTSAGAVELQIRDVALVVAEHAMAGAAIAAGTLVPTVITVNYPGNGYLQAAVNTAINLNLSAAFAAGGVSVHIWGTTE